MSTNTKPTSIREEVKKVLTDAEYRISQLMNANAVLKIYIEENTLDNQVPDTPPTPAPPNPLQEAMCLTKHVCSFLCIDIDAVRSESRKRPVVDARYIAMRIIKDNVPAITLKAIGSIFSNRDHSTVLNAFKQCEELIQTSKDFREKYERVIRYLQKIIDNELETGTQDS